jgi:hypothetical protein
MARHTKILKGREIKRQVDGKIEIWKDRRQRDRRQKTESQKDI